MADEPTTQARIALMREIGEALYGENWRRRLAFDVGLQPENLRLAMVGLRGIPDRVMVQLPDVAKQGASELAARAERLAKLHAKAKRESKL